MSNISKTKTIHLLRTLVIFILIGFITWSSIKLVAIAPEAFSSLASLTESLKEHRDTLSDNQTENNTLVITGSKSILPVDETVELSWSPVEKSGAYIFSFTCTEGIALDILNVEGIHNISCDTIYNIGDISELSINVQSEKKRFSEVNYTIAFLGINDTEPRTSDSNSFTVVNDTIPLILAEADAEPLTGPEETVTENTEESPITEVETVRPSVIKPAAPVHTQEYVYAVPISDPAGKTDLSVSFINTGNITDNTFTAGKVTRNKTGAIQFQVKNYGTKTSEDWFFSTSLPNGDTYKSVAQTPLKPNERAVLTISFIPTNKISHDFEVQVAESSDRNTFNNSFKQIVNFIK